MSQVQIITVGPGDTDQRLDRWLKRLFPHLAQGRIEKMCRKGEVRVDGDRVKASTRLSTGQEVRIPPLPTPGEVESRPKPTVSDKDAAMMKSLVLFKDDHIIALNKPPGLPTQGGSKQTRHVDGLAEALTFGFDEKPRLVHRLDKDWLRKNRHMELTSSINQIFAGIIRSQVPTRRTHPLLSAHAHAYRMRTFR